MPTPYFKISAGGVDITSKLVGRGISLTINDGVGVESDTIALSIDDHDGIVKAPRTGVILDVEGGYLDGERRNFGQFKVDQVTYNGYPQKIDISAQAVDAKSAQKQQRVDQFPKEDFPTFGDIYAKVAGRMGLQLAISAEIGSKSVSFEFQSEESDLSFATRLGRRLDASVTVKSGRLVVAKRGTGKSVSGQPLPTILVTGGSNVLTYSVTRKDKPKHSKVEATYFDRDKVEAVTVEAKIDSDGPTFLMRTPFQTKQDAELAAKAQAKELERGEASASFSINGAPSARAEAFVVASNIRGDVDGNWRAKSVTHNFSASSAYTTSIECELPDGEAS